MLYISKAHLKNTKEKIKPTITVVAEKGTSIFQHSKTIYSYTSLIQNIQPYKMCEHLYNLISLM